MICRTTRETGFTLLEMVVAIAIFAVIGAVSHVTLTGFIDTRDRVAAHNQRLVQLQSAIGHFERDVRFMMPRGIRDGLGEPTPPLSSAFAGAGGRLLEVTVAEPSFRDPRWHRLRRVGWSLQGRQLVRETWAVLDRDFDSLPRQTILLDGVQAVRLRYYERVVDSVAGRGTRIEIHDEWNQARSLPVAVELILTLEDETSIRRLVEVAHVPADA